ncbi:MAG: methyltransferase domain-containing protein [Caldilineaceae bacterium]
MLLRIRLKHEAGQWEVLIRLSPRPLSVRAWRVADMKGALNAAVAHAMVHLTKPQAVGQFSQSNLWFWNAAGGTAAWPHPRRLIGCDIDATALQYAQANLKAAQLQDRVELYDWDARSLNLPDRSVDAICADLPFGIAVGAHAQNVAHYPAILAEAARVAKPRGHFVLMTQEVTLLEALVQDNPTWKVLDQMMLTLRGLHPRIFVLQRTALPVR